ncbi:hypothetical protein BO94DRAFT_110480 [Aspergillus sclerotioniger CBS 115572]|uniref:Uncharacterized protein n=1 Tax=Aspergillus sclerotioniger CBS 115572 TaxID=1450535 RepID=A0A317WE85_9EURO|nr:hypothetical protein BO94DRAFT_110480 [Aspergillus sclerotioniger CBS 115572]PWY84693.1 hypothetical protein BO94DRAFT_110480 [Aspergillus sclerotioniger CBS 115572]
MTGLILHAPGDPLEQPLFTWFLLILSLFLPFSFFCCLCSLAVRDPYDTSTVPKPDRTPTLGSQIHVTVLYKYLTKPPTEIPRLLFSSLSFDFILFYFFQFFLGLFQLASIFGPFSLPSLKRAIILSRVLFHYYYYIFILFFPLLSLIHTYTHPSTLPFFFFALDPLFSLFE